MSGLGLIAVVGLCIGFGQFCFAMLVRGLKAPDGVRDFILQGLTSPWFYATGLLYGAGLIAYGFVLRQESLIVGNVSIILIVVALNAVMSGLIGESIGARQWMGLGLAMVSVALLRG